MAYRSPYCTAAMRRRIATRAALIRGVRFAGIITQEAFTAILLMGAVMLLIPALLSVF